MFGCLATFSERANFKPLWRPPFLSALVPEDRCHLNGLAMRDGRPAFVTVVSRSDVADGWRDKRHDGGCVLDVASGEAVCTGLSMPHSPRWYRDRLWVLNSGTGEFGQVDLASGRFVPIAFCPGYLRGLSFHGDYAIATLSKPRHVSFQGLALNERLSQKGAEPQCGLQIIDLRSWIDLRLAAAGRHAGHGAVRHRRASRSPAADGGRLQDQRNRTPVACGRGRGNYNNLAIWRMAVRR